MQRNTRQLAYPGLLTIAMSGSIVFADTWNPGSAAGFIYPNSTASNIGIGTTTSTAITSKLTVAGGDLLVDNNRYFRAKNSSGAAQNLLGLTSGNILYFGSSGVTGMQWNSGGTVRLNLDNNGRLGIGMGTTAPTVELDVAGRIRTVYSGTEILWGDSHPNATFGVTATNKDFGIRTQQTGNSMLTVKTDGKVGIGTNTPQARLDVLGGIRANDGAVLSGPSSKPTVHMSGGPSIPFASMRDKWNLPTTNSANGWLPFITSNGNNASGFGILEGDNVSSPTVWMYNYGGRNAFTVAKKAYQNGVGDNPSAIDDVLTPLFQVRENGQVGIGTTNPDADLKIGNNTGSYSLKLGGLAPGGGGLILKNQVTPGTSTSSSNPATGGFFFYENGDGSNGHVRSLEIGTRDYADEWNGGSQIRFLTSGLAPTGTSGTQNSKERMVITRDGKVGIGTSSPAEKLHVAGKVRVDGEIQVTSVRTQTWTVAPDYVFEKDYKLKSLEEVDRFVQKHKHLPEVPSAKEFKEKGMDLAEMNFTLLKKVEELTLHVIRLEKEMKHQSGENSRQAREISRLKGLR